MTYIVMAIVLVGGALLQVTLPAHACLGHVKVPFLLAAVLYYALSRDMPTMLVAAFAAGLLQDALTPVMPLGNSVLTFCIVGSGVGLFRKMVLTESLMTSATFGAAGAAATIVILYILLLKQGAVVCPAGKVALKTVSAGVLGMLCAPFVFAFARKLDGLVGNVELRESIDGLD